jgi:hypothetical protein
VAEFVGALVNVKELCQADDDAALVKASAVVALAEKGIAAAVRLRIADKQTIKHLARALKFTFPQSDLGVMTALKEQVHVTRAQIEMLEQAEIV